jgi:hypothetical protein
MHVINIATKLTVGKAAISSLDQSLTVGKAAISSLDQSLRGSEVSVPGIRWLPSHEGKCPQPLVYIDHAAAKAAYDSMDPFWQRCHDGLVSNDEIYAHSLELLEEAKAEYAAEQAAEIAAMAKKV